MNTFLEYFPAKNFETVDSTILRINEYAKFNHLDFVQHEVDRDSHYGIVGISVIFKYANAK